MKAYDNISNIKIFEISSHVENENNYTNEINYVTRKSISYWNGLHILSILAICAVHLIPLSIIPRNNSIIYQSYWFEFNLPVAIFMILMTANDLLNLLVFTKEESLLCKPVFLRLYSLYLMAWIVPYILSYWLWSVYLSYNHPMPYLGFNFIISQIIFMVGIWFVLPSDLLSKPEFRRKMTIYTWYFLWSLMLVIQNEVIAFMFKNLPSMLQWIMAFIIPALKELDKYVRTRMVNKMAGCNDEAATVLLGVAINLLYAMIIAVRFVGAETITVVLIMMVEFAHHLIMTYQSIKIHEKVTYYDDEDQSVEKKKSLTNIVLAELTEGITPLAYATAIAMAYYGPNAHILGNIKNNYWGYEKVENIQRVFQMLFLLFAVDTVSVLFNAFWLWTRVNVNLFREFCSVLGNYWYLIATKLAMIIAANFATNDINLGMDATREFNWITAEGRLGLMNNSMELPTDG